MTDSIAILDFGSQYTQLIARRIREMQVYCEIFAWDASPEKVLAINPKGFILSGGPSSVYEEKAPFISPFILTSSLPILGICYGMQALASALGGQVIAANSREYGLAQIHVSKQNPLLTAIDQNVWMSHGDRLERIPPGFEIFAQSSNCPFAGMYDAKRQYYGLQFHPEVRHTERGKEILSHFVLGICACLPDWTPQSIIENSIHSIRDQIGKLKVIAAVSGGVDSTVATALVSRAVGDQLSTVFIDTGLLRQGEVAQVQSGFKKAMGVELTTIDARDRFFSSLSGVTDPERKRMIIGELFIRLFEDQAEKVGRPPFLVQGTIYPDVVESSAAVSGKSARIKSHHNVGGLPEKMQFKLVEPLRSLFKDEVRVIGEQLGLPRELVWRQPFPGPGLAVRCLGEVTPERIERLRAADAIFISELEKENLFAFSSDQEKPLLSQAFAVLLPVQSVGVMGDNRTYQETVALRAVTTEDFMTADWAHLSPDLLARVSSRIVNEVAGVNRVVYDITSKPPSTIEWE